MEVHDLYFNTPARRKFLKSEATDLRISEEAFKRIALSRSDIAFTLQHNGLIRSHLPAADAKARITAILGEEFSQTRYMSKMMRRTCGYPAWLRCRPIPDLPAMPSTFFVNGRYVRDKLIAHAMREAYRDILHHDRHPAFVLFLEIDADGVDVNVHPTKTELNSADSRALHQFIFHAVDKALASPRHVSSASISVHDQT